VDFQMGGASCHRSMQETQTKHSPFLQKTNIWVQSMISMKIRMDVAHSCEEKMISLW
jgi:hypothetical protein